MYKNLSRLLLCRYVSLTFLVVYMYSFFALRPDISDFDIYSLDYVLICPMFNCDIYSLDYVLICPMFVHAYLAWLP